MVVAQPVAGGAGGRSSIAALSVSHRSIGRHPNRRWGRILARISQSASWALKSSGPVNDRPGKNEVRGIHLTGPSWGYGSRAASSAGRGLPAVGG